MLMGEVQAMKGDEVPLIPVNLKALPLAEHVDTIPMDPSTTRSYGSSRKPCRHALRCWPAGQPWSQVKVSASPT